MQRWARRRLARRGPAGVRVRLEALLHDGAWLSLDGYPGGKLSDPEPRRLTWEQRNQVVCALIDRGWVGRLMLGHDHAPALRPRDTPTRYLFLTKTAIPALLADDVSQRNIDVMMREAPRAFLTGGRVDISPEA